MNLNKRTLIRIRKERERQNISQQAMAKRLHISVSAYSRLESGEVALTFNMIEKIFHGCFNSNHRNKSRLTGKSSQPTESEV